LLHEFSPGHSTIKIDSNRQTRREDHIKLLLGEQRSMASGAGQQGLGYVPPVTLFLCALCSPA
jgi:hypothetical protein